MDRCAKCGGQRPGRDVRIYYGNKIAKSSAQYGTGKNAMVITTTRYAIGGWEDVKVCDRCTRIRSLWRFMNVLWSVPLGLGCAWFFFLFIVELFSGGIHGGFNAYYVVFLFSCGLLGIIKTADYVKCLVKPLNETSRSAVARPIVIRRQRAKEYNTFWVKRGQRARYDTFWTQAELDKLKLG
jgi:hypothetical protein